MRGDNSMSIFSESLSYRPFKYPSAVQKEKEEVIDKYWHEGQIDLQTDLGQYFSKDGLATPNFSHEYNKRNIDTLLLFFTQLDMSVAGGYVELLPHAKNNEIRCLLIQQAAKEVRHQRAYALAGESFGFEDADWSKFTKYKALVDKVDVMCSDIGDLSKPLNFAKKLAQVLLGEGIGLFAAFTSLLNLKRSGILMGFNDVNSWSLFDEEGHVANNIQVLQHIIEEDLTGEERSELEKFVRDTAAEYVKAEFAVVDMLGDQEDLSKDQLKAYLTFLEKLRLYQIGYVGHLEVGVNPVSWMDDMLVAEKHGAFFEMKVAEYSHKMLEGEVDYNKYLPLIDAKYVVS